MARLFAPIEAWFPVPDDPDRAEVLIRHLEEGERAAITAASHRTVTRYTKDGPVTETEHDLALDRKLTIRACVRDWKRFFDADGEPLECTDENKDRFAALGWFADFVAERRKVLAERAAAEREAQRKN